MGADPAAELSELADVMGRLRRDHLEEMARHLAERVAGGDKSAMDEYKRINAQLQALNTSTTT